MLVGINTRLNIGRIFRDTREGTDGLNMDFQLLAARGGNYLLYAAVGDAAVGDAAVGDRKSFNISDSILGPLGVPLGVPLQAALDAVNAGFFIISASEEVLSEKPFAAAPVPPYAIKRANEDARAKGGRALSFWFTAKISETSVFGNLIKIGGDGVQGRYLGFSARLDCNKGIADGLRNAEFQAYFPDINILGAVTLTEVSVSYAFGADGGRQFDLQGNILLEMFGREYRFHGDLGVNDTELKADVAERDGAVLAVPGPGAKTLFSLSTLYFGVKHCFNDASSTMIYVSGKVSLFNLALSARLWLIDGSVRLASIDLTKGFSIAAFIQEITGGNALGGDVDVTVRGGSFYYNRGDELKLNGAVYRPGVNLRASFGIELWFLEVDASGEVSVKDGDIQASIELTRDLDLHVFKISQAAFFIHSETVEDQPQTACGVSGEIWLFGKNCGCGPVELFFSNESGASVVRGKWGLRNAALVKLLGDKSIEFRYSSLGGVSFKGFESLKIIRDIKELADMLKNAVNVAGKARCEKIVEFVWEKLFTPVYDSEITIGYGDDAGVVLQAGFTFTLRFANTDEALFTTDFTGLTIRANADSFSSFENFVGMLGKAFTEAVTGFLLDENNCASLAKVVAYFAGEKVAKAAATMVCKGLIRDAQKTSMEKMIESVVKGLGKAGIKAGSAAGTIIAAGEAAGGGLAALGTVFAVAGVLITGSGGSGGGDSGDDDSGDDDSGDDDSGDDDSGGGDVEIPVINPPTDVKAEFVAESGNRFIVRWKKSDNAYCYIVRAFSDTGERLGEHRVCFAQDAYELEVNLSGIHAYIDFTVTGAVGTTFFSVPASARLSAPDAPKNLRCAWEGGVAAISWDAVNGASVYAVRFAGVGRETLIDVRGDTRLIIPQDGVGVFAEPGVYNVSVSAGFGFAPLNSAFCDSAAIEWVCLPETPDEPTDPGETPDEPGTLDIPEEDDDMRDMSEMVKECVAMLDKYYDKVKALPNNNSRAVSLEGGDLSDWTNKYYVSLADPDNGILQDASFFEDPVRNFNVGIGRDGKFYKYEYVQFMYRAYRYLHYQRPSFGTNAGTRFIRECVDMLDPYVREFQGKGITDTNSLRLQGSELSDWLKGYYPILVKTGLIADGSFFGSVDANPNYGIGADGVFFGKELLFFLWQAYRYVYILGK